ncbi:MAG: hypothetical protein HY554_04945 [Elusimicrobia bacterium]|nr:hypothetical protein [Elusimicrobiota bacterium]
MKIARSALVAASLLLGGALLEASLWAGLRNLGVVAALPNALQSLFREAYRFGSRPIIQMDRSCTIHHGTLTYTLRPGTCAFSGAEFETRYHINSAGLRDDEESLEAPEIIVLGDSTAMGWGVEQRDAFPSVLERKTGLKTLNAGVSSYGSVREMTLLGMLDTRRLRHLLIQYSANDFEENRMIRGPGDRLPIMDKETFERSQERFARGLGYFPGKHLLSLAKACLRRLRDVLYGAPDVSGEAEAFVRVLSLLGSPRLERAQVTLFAVDRDSPFADAVRQALARGRQPRWLREAKVMDLSDIPRRENFYALDGHLAPRGHERVAEKLLAASGLDIAQGSSSIGRR